MTDITLEDVLKYIEQSKVNYVIVDKDTNEPSELWEDTKLPVVFGDIADAKSLCLVSDKVITEYEFICNYLRIGIQNPTER